MKGRAWLGLAAWTVLTGAAWAQLPEDTIAPPTGEVSQVPDIPVPPGDKPFEAPPPKVTPEPLYSPLATWENGQHCGANGCDNGVCGLPGCFWVRADYLLWWTRGQQLPPIVTTAPPGTPIGTAGLLGQPGTRILFGGERDDADTRSGYRLTAGFWLNKEHTFGIEGSFFQLDNETNSFSVNSAHTPIITLPFFDPDGSQHRRITSFPGFSTGSVDITSSSRFYGGDVHFLCNLCCSCCWRVDALLGYRALRLNEDLNMVDTELSTVTGQRIVEVDRFGTRNNFNGADLGITAQYRHCNWTVDLMARVALGVNDREVNINGTSTFSAPGVTTITRPGGFFALPTNIGSHHDNEFS